MFTRGIGAPQPRRHAADAVSIISCARLALPLLLDVRAKRLSARDENRNQRALQRRRDDAAARRTQHISWGIATKRAAKIGAMVERDGDARCT